MIVARPLGSLRLAQRGGGIGACSGLTCWPVATSTAVYTVPEALGGGEGRGREGGREGGGREENQWVDKGHSLGVLVSVSTCSCL